MSTTANHAAAWTVEPVENLIDSIDYGLTAKAATGEGPRFLRITDIQDGKVDWSSVPSCACSPEDVERVRLSSGDLVFARTGATTGKSFLIRTCPADAVFASYLIRLRPNPKVEPAYLAYFFQTADYWRQIREQSTGTAQPGVNATRLRTLLIPVAPREAQARIVAAIDSHFSRLDAATTTMERVQRNLERYRASVLKAAVQGRLVPTEAELARKEGRSYEPASVLLQRILAERRRRWEEAELSKLKAKGKVPADGKWKAKYPEPVAPDIDGLPELPEGWCLASVDQVLRNHDGTRIPVKRLDRSKRHGAYAYYGASGPIDTIDDYLFDGSYLLVGEDGANLLARSTPIAFQAHGKFWVNNHAHVLSSFLELPLGYFECVFNSMDLAKFVTGTAQPKLPQASMNKMALPLPPAFEQARIVESLTLLDSSSIAVREAAHVSLRRLGRLRQSILKWAFEGRLVDPDPVQPESGNVNPPNERKPATQNS